EEGSVKFQKFLEKTQRDSVRISSESLKTKAKPRSPRVFSMATSAPCQFRHAIGIAPIQPRPGAWVYRSGRFASGNTAHSASVQIWRRQSIGPAVISIKLSLKAVTLGDRLWSRPSPAISARLLDRMGLLP